MKNYLSFIIYFVIGAILGGSSIFWGIELLRNTLPESLYNSLPSTLAVILPLIIITILLAFFIFVFDAGVLTSKLIKLGMFFAGGIVVIVWLVSSIRIGF